MPPGCDLADYDTIPVPSVWQNYGYDHHQYTNIRYPFPADPPYVPKENPAVLIFMILTTSRTKLPRAPT